MSITKKEIRNIDVRDMEIEVREIKLCELNGKEPIYQPALYPLIIFL
jgi:hypothetical protein